jgi:hypothetical protein
VVGVVAVGIADGATAAGCCTTTVVSFAGADGFDLNTPAAASAIAAPPRARIVTQMAMIGHFDEEGGAAYAGGGP